MAKRATPDNIRAYIRAHPNTTAAEVIKQFPSAPKQRVYTAMSVERKAGNLQTPSRTQATSKPGKRRKSGPVPGAQTSSAELVREYMAEHPDAAPGEIAKACKVHISTVYSQRSTKTKARGHAMDNGAFSDDVRLLVAVGKLANEHGLDKIKRSLGAIEALSQSSE